MKNSDEEKYGIVALASGNGTNLQAIIDNEKKGKLNGRVIAVISDRKDATALKRAEAHGIPGIYVGKFSGESRDSYSRRIGQAVSEYSPDMVILSGFMRILTKPFFDIIKVPVLNIHPALLPCFGGKGMYGMHVHEAVISSGAMYSGCTVHLVTPEVDSGPVIIQKIVDVMDNDTPESLAARVLEKEHVAYTEAINIICEGNYKVINNRVVKM